MTLKLFAQAIVKFTLGAALAALLIFLPAGTAHYWQGGCLKGLSGYKEYKAGVKYRLLPFIW